MDSSDKSTLLARSLRLIGITVLRLIGITAKLAVLLFLLPLAVTAGSDLDAYEAVRYLLEIDRQCIDFVRNVFPLKLGGHDTARAISILLAIAANLASGGLKKHFFRRKIDQPVSEKYTVETSVKSRTALLEVIREAQSRIDVIDKGASGDVQGRDAAPSVASAERNRNRARLVAVMAEAKTRLEAMQRDLAFLSIDVAGSTQMKVGEDKLKIEMAFRNYKKFVDQAINNGGSLTSAWTPDGVMICFPNADAAVTTSKNVISGLRHFNLKDKVIRADFKVRCGINAGRVYYDPLIPMEEMSDRVIDIAGHMQKYAEPDSIFLSNTVADKLAQIPKEGFRPANTKVDGLEVYKWNNN
jgi:class 3 adenylate cyclase